MADVVVTGTGEVERLADRAAVSVAFQGNGPDRPGAVQALTTRVAAVERVLERPGVEVRSRRLSVLDNWKGSRRSGSSAVQNYELRVTDPAVLDELVGALVAAEPQWLNGPNWSLADPAEATREAQARAVADARARAEGYAAALGGRLGALVRLADGDARGPVPGAFGGGYGVARSAGGAPDISELNLTPQPVAVSASCTATWTLVE
jgi:uncharacterized protein YggE